MALYRYVKSVPGPLRFAPRRRIRGLSFMLMTGGALLLLWVAWPIVSFSLTSDSAFAQIIAPVADTPQGKPANVSLSPIALAAGSTDTGTTQPTLDFTNANVWYPTAPQKKTTGRVNTYTLTIAKLKIDNALVVVGGDDLSKSLIHYGGTGIPGEYGTTVVFGHSTLPQFFSPTNYKSIFSLLPTLEIGDEIGVVYDGVSYTYEVYEMVVLDPTDLSTLEQRFDDSYLTLVTCVPPGTYWKRLNVKAKLKSL